MRSTYQNFAITDFKEPSLKAEEYKRLTKTLQSQTFRKPSLKIEECYYHIISEDLPKLCYHRL